MKLAAALLASLIGLSTAAYADDAPYAGPPGGMPEAQVGATADYRLAPPPARGPRRAGPGGAAMQSALVARFDRDGDGRLDHGERRRAAKALRRMANRLARSERRPQPRGLRAPQPGDPRVDVDVRWDGR